ncbi:hypothetical protein BGX38DRAFT_757098 [Terfezia claveryi]|nr:hypothetical protein BGX38DRAFT_757098 [Terfezia claveryi]
MVWGGYSWLVLELMASIYIPSSIFFVIPLPLFPFGPTTGFIPFQDGVSLNHIVARMGFSSSTLLGLSGSRVFVL